MDQLNPRALVRLLMPVAERYSHSLKAVWVKPEGVYSYCLQRHAI